MTDELTGTHCVTCADELARVVVLSLDGAVASVAGDNGENCQIAVDLVDDVRVGDALLVHGGVALQRAGEERATLREESR